MTGATLTSGTGTAPEGETTSHEARVAELKAAMPKWLDAAAGVTPPVARNPSLPTLVGLLILILCFFVVLTSISIKDKKREQSVMASLSQTFTKEGMAPPPTAAEAEVQTRKLLGDLRATLNAEVPLLTGVKPETANDYAMNLPRNLVFAEDGTLASGFSGILAEAMKALKTGPADFAYEVEVALSAPQMDAKAIAGASAVAGALRAAGFANDAASVSLEPGKGDFIGLTIRLRPDARLGQP